MDKKVIRVMLIEDDEDDFILTRDLLTGETNEAYEVSWVDNFDDGVAAVKERSHDVFLIDYNLGLNTGIDLVEHVVKLGCLAPLIMLTGMDNLAVDKLALQAGAADYLVKSEVDTEQLERSIRYAMERSRLLKKLSEQAIRDGLTGLINRREIDRSLNYELERAKRYGTDLSLVMLDIDKFKSVNDEYGHQAGDEILRILARRLFGNVRATDRVGRYGGEEFTIMLPETNTEVALVLADRLREKIAEETFEFYLAEGEKISLSITVSMGVAGYSPEVQSLEQLVRASDKALYRSKENGRNLVTVYDQSMS